MEKSQNIGPENREMAEALEKLKKYVADGFVLHGSKNKIEVIKPRQAHDDNRDRKEGNLHGIYATDDVRVAIAKALFDIKDKSRRSWKSSYSINSMQEMRVGGENATFTPGFVHVLPKDKFEEVTGEEGKEIVAFQDVSPVDVIQVTPDILDLIPGITYEMQ